MSGSGSDEMRRNRVRSQRTVFAAFHVYISLVLGQTEYLRQKFLESLQNYQQVEQRHRANSRERIRRQYRIGQSILLFMLFTNLTS